MFQSLFPRGRNHDFDNDEEYRAVVDRAMRLAMTILESLSDPDVQQELRRMVLEVLSGDRRRVAA